MPHIIVEYAAPLEEIVLKENFKTEFIQKLLDHSDFDPSHLKYRSLKYSDYSCPSAEIFIHITLKMLQGRTEQQRIDVSRVTIEYLKKTFASFLDLQKTHIECTVEIQELEKNTYGKWIS
ncbi:MAG: hypothetical protein GY915_00235 [bacterium]|nr:hypothetical protein [bacterium]